MHNEDGPPFTDADLAALDFDAAGYWATVGGQPRSGNSAPPPLKPPTARDIARYRALPAGTRDGLKRLIVDQTPQIVDGRTHQFWDWTNRDVANVLRELVPAEIYELRHSSFDSAPCGLLPTGERVHRKPANHFFGDPPKILLRHSGPDMRFNAATLCDQRGRDAGAVRICAHHHDRTFGAQHFDPDAVNELRRAYQRARSTQERVRNERRSQRDDQRAKVIYIAVWLTVLALVAVGIVWLAS